MINKKYKEIISLIESLSVEEIKFLITYLNEAPWPEKEPLSTSAETIMQLAEIDKDLLSNLNKNKQLLLTADSHGTTIAHWLAYYSKDGLNWYIDDKEVLKTKNKDGIAVAHVLAYYHPQWHAEDKDILNLKDGNGKTVKEWLENKKKK